MNGPTGVRQSRLITPRPKCQLGVAQKGEAEFYTAAKSVLAVWVTNLPAPADAECESRYPCQLCHTQPPEGQRRSDGSD